MSFKYLSIDERIAQYIQLCVHGNDEVEGYINYLIRNNEMPSEIVIDEDNDVFLMIAPRVVEVKILGEEFLFYFNFKCLKFWANDNYKRVIVYSDDLYCADEVFRNSALKFLSEALRIYGFSGQGTKCSRFSRNNIEFPGIELLPSSKEKRDQ